MALFAAIGIGLAIASIASTGISLLKANEAQKDQKKAQKEAFDLQQKEQKFRIERMKKEAFERGRIVRAQAESAQTLAGAGSPDNSAIGGAYSVTSQTGTNLFNLNSAYGFMDASAEVNDIFAQASRNAGQSSAWAGASQLLGVGAQFGLSAGSGGATGTTPNLPGDPSRNPYDVRRS